MMKSEVIAILVAEKEKEVADVAAKFDAMIAQVEGLSDDVPSSDEQVSALQAKLAEVEAAAEALRLAEEAEDVDQNSKIANLEAFKARVKAVVNQDEVVPVVPVVEA